MEQTKLPIFVAVMCMLRQGILGKVGHILAIHGWIFIIFEAKHIRIFQFVTADAHLFFPE